MTSKKVFMLGFCLVLLWICSALVGSFLNDITGGPPGNIRNDIPFFERWKGDAFMVGWLLISFWYVFLFFGAWVAFSPPCRWWVWLAFSLVAVGAGLLASRDFQHLGTWDYELADNNVVSPPAEATAIYANLLCCVTAVFSTTLCVFVARRWFHHLSSRTDGTLSPS